VLYAWILVDRAGGWRQIPHEIGRLYGPAFHDRILSFGPVSWDSAAMIFIAVISVQWFAQVNADGSGYLAQRTMACENPREVKFAVVIFTWMQIFFRSLAWLPIALALLVLYPAVLPESSGAASEVFRASREATFIRGIQDFLPPGVRGLVLTGLLAALASTVDTHLNWGASYWTNDIYKRFAAEKILKRRPSNPELVWVARLSNLGILALAIGIMTRLDSIQTAWHLSLLLGSGTGVVLILRWFWHRINLWSEVSAILASLVMAPVLLLGFPAMDEGLRLLVMAGVSTAIMITVTLSTPSEPRQVLVDFFERARPPGFWGPAVQTPESADESQRLFRKGMCATVFGALSLFCMLIGFGIFVTGNFTAPWGPGLWILVGALLLPFWLGFVFKDAS